MSILHAVVFGLVQGLGEFLPISSSAHLVLVPWFFGWEDPGLSFDIALHVGTLVAVVIYFWKDWVQLIAKGFTDARSVEGRLFWYLVLASIPGAIGGFLLEKSAETIFRSPKTSRMAKSIDRSRASRSSDTQRCLRCMDKVG